MRRLFDFLCSPTSGARLQRPLMRWTAAALLQHLHQALQAAEHGEEASWAAQVPSTEAGRWATAFCEVSSGDPLFAAAISLLLCPAFGDSVQVWAIACWARAETLHESYCRARRAAVQQTVQQPVHDPGHGAVKDILKVHGNAEICTSCHRFVLHISFCSCNLLGCSYEMQQGCGAGRGHQGAG